VWWVSSICQEARSEVDRRAEGYPPHCHADVADLQLPEQVSVAGAELAGAAREGLLALAVGNESVDLGRR
jgi:hypothetical protein